jgi:hypothetical protein
VLARCEQAVLLEPANAESLAVRWWALDDVATLRLHVGFAQAWPHLRERLAT